MVTHTVFNQPTALTDYNLFAGNAAMRSALAFNAPALDTAPLVDLGWDLGRTERQTHARLANVFTPQLHNHDRTGRRIDRVEFHPSYHHLMTAGVTAGLHGTPWTGSEDGHAHPCAALRDSCCSPSSSRRFYARFP